MSEVGAVLLRPTALSLLPDNIPPSLTALNQWVCWKYVLKGGKYTKVPFQTNGRTASPTDPVTWTSFDIAVTAYQRGRDAQLYDGVGIALDGKLAHDGLTLAAVDIDKAVGDPKRAALAQAIIRSMSSYTELSPSGQGYRIFTRARPLRTGVNRKGVELYTSGRYLTVTGHVLGSVHD